MQDNSEAMYRADTELTKYIIEREDYYTRMAIQLGDAVQRPQPGVIQIRILKPRKDKEKKDKDNA